MPNIYLGTINGNIPSRAGVGITSEIIISDNPKRSGLIITNISDQTVYIAVGQTATLSAGIVLNAGGGAWSMDDYTYSKEAITAVGHAATLVVAFQEFQEVK